jgi:energy-coupling factor transport system permease protein
MATIAPAPSDRGAAFAGRAGRRLPRPLHPGAWWLWAIGLATAATRTTNPLLLCLVILVVAHVVSARRTDAPWARGFSAYLVLAFIVVCIRVLFRMLLGGDVGGTVLFTLPEIPLPDAAAGIRLGGPVSAEGVLAAVYDGLRLATLLVCVGGANVLANPKRLLKAVPGALHEVGVTITVALTVAPQLVESGRRVHRARRLRGETGRRSHLVRAVAMPVMTDALDRSLLLAASMDSRGYGRRGAVPPSQRRITSAMLLGGLGGVCIGTYGLLDTTTPAILGAPMLVAGLGAAVGAFVLTGRRVSRTRYRPDPWNWPEWTVGACGLVAAAAVLATAAVDPTSIDPPTSPLQWPPLPLAAAAGIAVAALPAWLAPPVGTDPEIPA